MNVDALRGLAQPDQRSCGPSSLVAARMLLDPAYAPASFADDVLTLHRELTAPSYAGRAQLPWPRALGTPPWAVARAMTAYSGVPHSTTVTLFHDRGALVTRMQAATAAGQPVPFYVGDRWLPRHVVLAVGPTDSGLRVYNPARGALVDVTTAAFAGSTLSLGRWTKPWFVILPEAL